MMVFFRRGVAGALLFISATQVAQAEVTAQDVWSGWKDYMISAGQEVTGTETMSGDTLTISDLTIVMQMPENQGSVSLTMPSLVLAGSSDGTVAMTMPGSVPMHITFTEAGETFDAVLNLSQSGHSMIVSGNPKDMTYSYAASQVGLTLASLSIDGVQVPSDLAKMAVTLTNVISSTRMTLADMYTHSQRLSADSLSYDLAFTNPDTNGTGAFTGSVLGLSFQGGGVMPLAMNTADIQAMMAAGTAFDGVFEYDSGSSSMHVVEGAEDILITSSSQGGKLSVAMSGAQMSYDLGQTDTAIKVITNQLPFPIELEMAEVRFAIDMPLAKSDEEQDFSYVMKLRDFTMSDLIWGMFDPGAVLPRDPASIVLDLSGKVRILVDLFDPAMADNLVAAPGELNALKINEFLISVAGAKLSGTGDFAFDNSNLTAFDGMPAPTGVANLELVGANGLIDRLIQMGILSDSDAMGARMMMALMAVPGAGEDSLTSKIEINDQGHILANGQRLK